VINVAIQALTLLSGMLVNFVVPALYGLESYGAFIQANILVFVFQKLTDIVNEPLISHVEGRYVFATSLLMGGVVMLLFLITNSFDPIGNPLLLGVMLVSSCCLLSMYALRQQVRLLVYLVVFLGVFGLLLALKMLADWQLSIVDVLVWTNLVPGFLAALGLVSSGSRLPPGKQLLSTMGNTIAMLPRMISVTLVFNLLTNILPYILSKTLPVRDLGLFRVVTSVIQSATSLFPLNTKAIFVAFVGGERRETLFKTIMSASLLYFSILGVFGYLLAWMVPKLSPYLVLVASLPVLYWAVVSERYLLASGSRRQVMIANLTVGLLAVLGVFFVHELKQAVIFYALGFSAYALVLHACCQPRFHSGAMYWVVILSPCVIWLQAKSIFIPICYMVSLIILATVVLRFRPADLRNLRF
jgi:hypothetical protein